jgi:hypothetical protein
MARSGVHIAMSPARTALPAARDKIFSAIVIPSIVVFLVVPNMACHAGRKGDSNDGPDPNLGQAVAERHQDDPDRKRPIDKKAIRREYEAPHGTRNKHEALGRLRISYEAPDRLRISYEAPDRLRTPYEAPDRRRIF